MADEKSKLILCPYCGNTQSEPADRCAACGGYFDNLSLKVTQQHMGPWFVRDRHNPFRPGCSYEVLKKQIERGKVKATTIIRGPTTRQFWSVARNVPGVAHLLGYCHGCGGHVDPDAERCPQCQTRFFEPRLRDKLGLAPAGAEVPSHEQLTGTGAGDEASEGGLRFPAEQAAGGGGAEATTAVASPEAERASAGVGSPILAGMRDEPAGGAAAGRREAGAVTQATAQAQRARQAMTWMTAEGEGEPDTLATAGEPTAAVQRSTNWWTWLLIAINVGLFAVVIAAAVIIINTQQGGEGGAQPAGAGPAVVDQRDDSPDGEGGEPAETDAEAEADADDRTNGGEAAETGDGDEPAPEIFAEGGEDAADAPADEWTRRYERAMELEQAGELSDALKLLKAIRANAPDDAKPADLDQSIQRVEQELDRQAEELFG